MSYWELEPFFYHFLGDPEQIVPSQSSSVASPTGDNNSNNNSHLRTIILKIKEGRAHPCLSAKPHTGMYLMAIDYYCHFYDYRSRVLLWYHLEKSQSSQQSQADASIATESRLFLPWVAQLALPIPSDTASHGRRDARDETALDSASDLGCQVGFWKISCSPPGAYFGRLLVIL